MSTGLFLGELTDEIEGYEMLEWVSAGSKQYGMKLKRIEDGRIEHVVKMRGITLNHDIIENQGLQYETFKTKVLDYVKNGIPDPMIVNYPHFIRSNIVDGCVYTQPYSTVVKPVVCKGCVDPTSYDVRHFGFTKQ